MSSLLTNTSAMSALSSLSMTQKSLAGVQKQISTGLRVGDASDNAAYWSIATTMRSDTGALGAVSDALNLGSSTLGVATAALNSTLTIMNKLKNDIITAQTPGTDKTQIETDISALQSSLLSITSAASFNGVNLLNATAVNTNIVSSFSRGTSGSTSVGTISVATSQHHLDFGDGRQRHPVGHNGGRDDRRRWRRRCPPPRRVRPAAGTDADQLQCRQPAGVQADDLDDDERPCGDPGQYRDGHHQHHQGRRGSWLDQDQHRQSGNSSCRLLSDSITSGVGSLVDADMNVASTKLQALQTQQQLGIQSLSIANQNSQLILKLFQ